MANIVHRTSHQKLTTLKSKFSKINIDIWKLENVKFPLSCPTSPPTHRCIILRTSPPFYLDEIDINRAQKQIKSSSIKISDRARYNSNSVELEEKDRALYSTVGFPPGPLAYRAPIRPSSILNPRLVRHRARPVDIVLESFRALLPQIEHDY